MALKKKSKVTSMFSVTDVQKLAEEYNTLSLQMKELKAKRDNLADQLKKCAESMGVVDDKGSSYIDGDNFIVGRVAKHSVKVNQEKGVDFLRSKGLDNCITTKTTYTVNEKEVEKLVADETLTEEEVGSFVSVETSYSVSVKAKEEMPEVEVSAAARKKK